MKKNLLYILFLIVLVLSNNNNINANNITSTNIDVQDVTSTNVDVKDVTSTNVDVKDVANSNEEEEELNVSEIIFGHTADSYEFDILTFPEKKIAISLPVILISKNSGFNVFLSSKLNNGKTYKGFKIATGNSKYKDKIVEVVDGEEIRPFDISITKNVVGIFISCILLIIIVLSVSRWYKRNPDDVPKGFIGAVDQLANSINDGVIKPSIGEKSDKFAPFLLTMFFFIFLSNILGLIPIFPAGANLTGNISVTLALALCTFFTVNVFGNKHYWKDILWPDVPIFLKVPIPIVPIIELFGIFTKPFALMMRLFANLLAGHAIVISICCVVFITAKMGAALNASMSVVSVFFMIFMDCIELLVAFIQAYIFTFLSAIFIGMAQENPDKEKVKKKVEVKN